MSPRRGRRRRRPMPEVPPARAVEAALFSAGRPLTRTELAEATGLNRTAVRNGLRELQEQLAAADTALEVAVMGGKWAMQLKARYAPFSQKLAPTEVPDRLLPTLALIAHEQPLLQSELKGLVGDKVYEHVRALVELGLVRKQADFPSYRLTTTEAFPDYFGIDARDPEAIREWLDKELGLGRR